MIKIYPRAMGWLLDLGAPNTGFYAVLWEMIPYGGALTAANDD